MFEDEQSNQQHQLIRPFDEQCSLFNYNDRIDNNSAVLSVIDSEHRVISFQSQTTMPSSVDTCLPTDTIHVRPGSQTSPTSIVKPLQIGYNTPMQSNALIEPPSATMKILSPLIVHNSNADYNHSSCSNPTIANVSSANNVTAESALCRLNSYECITLDQVLETFNSPINEEQAWAICFQFVQCVRSILRKRQEQQKSCDVMNSVNNNSPVTSLQQQLQHSFTATKLTTSATKLTSLVNTNATKISTKSILPTLSFSQPCKNGSFGSWSNANNNRSSQPPTHNNNHERLQLHLHWQGYVHENTRFANGKNDFKLDVIFCVKSV